MTSEPDRTSSPRPAIIVAGDVCIDWLSIPIESLVHRADSGPPMNWQLRDGRHMYAQHGGAWLTAALSGRWFFCDGNWTQAGTAS